MILLTFVAGLAFALGHHAFYYSLHGQPVEDHLFTQQINLAVGQAFAFLVRASLVISIGVSYWQVFWGTVLHGTFALSQVDVLAGMLGSVLDLLDLRASRTRPILVALALLSWMVPLASILPPATLSVHSNTTTEYTQRRVPVPQFDAGAMSFSTIISIGNGPHNTLYLKPTRRLTRLVTATAYRGAVPDHHTAFPNSTYTLNFPGPAMRCQVVPEDLLHDFNEPMNCSFMLNKIDDGPKGECDNAVTYISWVPGRELGAQRNLSAVESSVPFKPNSMINGTLPLEPQHGHFMNLDYDPRYIGGFTGGAASVYLATRSRRLPFDYNNWDVLNCSMYNASYSVNVISDSNNRGTLSKPEIRTLTSVPYINSALGARLSAKDSATFGYLALMEGVNRLIVGTIVGTLFGGSFSGRLNGYYEAESLTVQNQWFQQTLLPFTAELLPFQSYFLLDGISLESWPPDTRQWRKEVDTFEDSESGATYTVSYPNEAFLSPTFNRSLASVVEELFHNITLSLLNNEGFLQDSPEAINITYSITQNTYSYDSKNLLISYGLAVSFALLAGIAGCISIYLTGASYSNKFSTVLRTTRGPELEELVSHNDRTGVDPLPKRLAKSRIDLRCGQAESGRDGVGDWRPETVSEQRLL